MLENLYMQPGNMKKEVNVLSGGERVKTVLAVRHDRKLVENLADIIYELKDGKLVVYSPLSG